MRIRTPLTLMLETSRSPRSTIVSSVNRRRLESREGRVELPSPITKSRFGPRGYSRSCRATFSSPRRQTLPKHKKPRLIVRASKLSSDDMRPGLNHPLYPPARRRSVQSASRASWSVDDFSRTSMSEFGSCLALCVGFVGAGWKVEFQFIRQPAPQSCGHLS